MGFEEIKLFLRDFMSAWQTVRIYGIEHRLSVESLEKAYSSLGASLGGKNELVIGILEKELASGGHIFFELSKKVIQPITHLRKVGIERIVFSKGTSKEELIKFISFLISPTEEIKHAPQKCVSAAGIKNIEVGKIKASSGDSSGKSEIEESELMNYMGLLNRLPGLLDGLINSGTVDNFNLKLITNDIMENLKDGYQFFSGMIGQAKSYDESTFIHLLNVSILSIYLSHKLGFSREDCLDIGVAGLFHDIGKLYIAKKIIQKKDKLDQEEFDKVKSHTVLGAEILLGHIDSLTILPVVVAFEHHLQYDLEGYPKLSFSHKLHIASSIIAICDVYDALTHRRSYKRDFPPERIYEIMIKDRGKKFDPKLLDTFFEAMGVWPRKTIVCLQDGRIGIVRQENKNDIFSPVVEIVDKGPKELIDLGVKKEVKIKQSLNPLSEGQKYLSLI